MILYTTSIIHVKKIHQKKNYFHFSGYFLYFYGLIDYESTYALTHLRTYATAQIYCCLHFALQLLTGYFTLQSLKNAITQLMLLYFPAISECQLPVLPVQNLLCTNSDSLHEGQ